MQYTYKRHHVYAANQPPQRSGGAGLRARPREVCAAGFRASGRRAAGPAAGGLSASATLAACSVVVGKRQCEGDRMRASAVSGDLHVHDMRVEAVST